MDDCRPGTTDEARRLSALRALDLLDSAPEREFDALVTLAAQMLSCPTAMITLVDQDRLWVKACNDERPGDIPRSGSICDQAIRLSGPTIIADASRDPRFAAQPFVTGKEHVRFYAGVPIRSKGADGEFQAIGTICAFDTAPRSLSADGQAALGHLAALAEALIAARAAAMAAVATASESAQQAAALARQQRIFEQAERMAGIGSWRLDLDDERLTWSDQVFRIHGLPVGTYPSFADALSFYPPEARADIAGKLAGIIETGEPYDIETDFITAAGERRRVRSMAELERDAEDNPAALVGVFQDITDAHRLREQLRHAADTDFLTGIANRAAFQRALEGAMDRAARRGTPLALALVDLDGFKRVNDTFGHTVGDDALRAVADRLSEPWLAGCFAARLGGDEFALIVEDAGLMTDAVDFAARLDQAIRVTLDVEEMAVLCSGSVGVARHRGGEPTRDFLRRADEALYAAKRVRIGGRRAA